MTDEQSRGMNPALKIILGVAAVLLLLFCGGLAIVGWFVKEAVEEVRERGAVQPAEDPVAVTEHRLSSISLALTIHLLETEELPPDLATLTRGDGGLPEEWLSDGWGNPFVYERKGDDLRDYDLLSLGSDGLPGGEGDAADIARETIDRIDGIEDR